MILQIFHGAQGLGLCQLGFLQDVGKEFLDFPFEAAGMVIILHDVHAESLPGIMCTSCHELWALIVAMAPPDLWKLSCSRLVLSFSFLIFALLFSLDFLSFLLLTINAFDSKDKKGISIFGPSLIPKWI